MFGGFPFDFWVSAAAVAYFFGDFLSGDGVSSLLGVLVVLGWLWGFECLAFFLSGDGVYLERWFHFFGSPFEQRFGSGVFGDFNWYVITSDHIWLSFSHLFLSTFPSFQDSRGR